MTSSILKARITEDMKSAMRSKDVPLLSTIRLLLAALKQREVDERIELSDSDVLDAITKMIKQRKDSVAQFQTAGRTDLVDIETREIEHLQRYLPAQLSAEELNTLITEAVQRLGASGIKDMGKVMADIREKVHGRADMGAVGSLVKQFLV